MNDRLRLILLVMALSVTVALTGCSQPEQTVVQRQMIIQRPYKAVSILLPILQNGSITAPEGSELVKTLTDNNNNTVELYGYKSGSDEPFICFISIKDNDKNRFSKQKSTNSKPLPQTAEIMYMFMQMRKPNKAIELY